VLPREAALKLGWCYRSTLVLVPLAELASRTFVIDGFTRGVYALSDDTAREVAMPVMRAFLLSVMFALIAAPATNVAAACSDPAAAAMVRAQIATSCPCTSATNHGQHVSCVNHQLHQAMKSGALPKNCHGAVTRCAARSTCGKPGFVTCCFATPGTCVNGLCPDGTTACSAAVPCPAVIKCHIKSSAAACSMDGGSPGTGSCCDAVCAASPGGAFLDAQPF